MPSNRMREASYIPTANGVEKALGLQRIARANR